jgi:hypothetical protein
MQNHLQQTPAVPPWAYMPSPWAYRVGNAHSFTNCCASLTVMTSHFQHVWFASGNKLIAFDPANGMMLRSINVPAMQERPSTAST